MNEASPKWKPMNSRQRRVLGVLVEKAKTTPDIYPMTINGIVTGCNQKSNRDPLVNMESEEVEQVLGQLRELGAVTEVHGAGRGTKYRHNFYDWLGIDKLESAVMCELLLRGAQTLGELRVRASRMEPIPDLNALKSVVDLLLSKNLMLELTPAGRGQLVSHNLYKERELVEIRAELAGRPSPVQDEEETPTTSSIKTNTSLPVFQQSPPPLPAGGYVTKDMYNELQVEFAEVKAELARLREQVQNLQELIQS